MVTEPTKAPAGKEDMTLSVIIRVLLLKLKINAFLFLTSVYDINLTATVESPYLLSPQAM